jgi:hypothetical protein
MIDADRQYELGQAIYFQAGEIDPTENITGANDSELPLSYRPKDRLVTRLRDLCPIDGRMVETFVLGRMNDRTMDPETLQQIVEGHKRKRAGRVLTDRERTTRITVMGLEDSERRAAAKERAQQDEADRVRIYGGDETSSQERTAEPVLVLA